MRPALCTAPRHRLAVSTASSAPALITRRNASARTHGCRVPVARFPASRRHPGARRDSFRSRMTAFTVVPLPQMGQRSATAPSNECAWSSAHRVRWVASRCLSRRGRAACGGGCVGFAITRLSKGRPAGRHSKLRSKQSRGCRSQRDPRPFFPSPTMSSIFLARTPHGGRRLRVHTRRTPQTLRRAHGNPHARWEA